MVLQCTYIFVTFQVYFDGCVPNQVNNKGEITQTTKEMEIELGCKSGAGCIRNGVFDDLRFWAEEKSEAFMWWLFHM